METVTWVLNTEEEHFQTSNKQYVADKQTKKQTNKLCIIIVYSEGQELQTDTLGLDPGSRSMRRQI